jgi:DNA-binding NarL/FixJ family response regulator
MSDPRLPDDPGAAGPDPASAPVTVLVADDQRLVREGIASLLDIQEGIRVVGEAVNGEEAVEKALALRPDVILMDVRMPVLDGIAATAQVHRQLPGCQVIMLTTFDDEEYIVKSLRAGAVGYLLKDMPASQLAAAVRLAHSGIYQLEPSVAGKLVEMLADAAGERAGERGGERGHAAAPLPVDVDLTERELEVLRLIGTGATNREIADQLVVSEGTVKNHVSSILSRLSLRDRTQAALYAHQHGLT